MFSDVVVGVTFLSSSFVFVYSRGYVSAGLTGETGLAVGEFDLIKCSWSVFRFVFVLTISE